MKPHNHQSQHQQALSKATSGSSSSNTIRKISNAEHIDYVKKLKSLSKDL
jgi:hypothetical protein